MSVDLCVLKCDVLVRHGFPHAAELSKSTSGYILYGGRYAKFEALNRYKSSVARIKDSFYRAAWNADAV